MRFVADGQEPGTEKKSLIGDLAYIIKQQSR